MDTFKQEREDGDAPVASPCAGALFKNVNYGNRSHEVFLKSHSAVQQGYLKKLK